MNRYKRWLCAALALFLLLGLFPIIPLEADALYQEFDERYEVDGNDYTTSGKMASKLNAIFDGNANIYHDSGCTNLVNVRIGTSNVKNNGITMYAGPYGGRWVNAGTSCWIYAAGVYYTLFGDIGLATPTEHSEKLDLSKGNGRITSYANFKAWGVRDGVGAHIRTSSHSMIVLDYDEESLTILDGNNDGNGKVSVRKRSWDYVNYTVSYIVQPTDEFYRSEYPVYDCDHNYEWSITKNAGCVEDGVITYSCSKCSDSYTESTPATGHNFKNDICVVCGAADTSVLKGTCGKNLNWTLRTGTLTVTGAGAMYDYGYGGAPWFKNRTTIKKVVIDDKVTNVGDHAFAYSENLAKVTIGNGVEVIGDFAFQACTGITSLSLGSSVRTIGLEAFKYSSITDLKIPDSTTSIGDLAFGFCESLTQVDFGKNLKTLKGYAFYNTPSLKKITFTGKAPSIGEEAFLNARATVYYPTNDSTWKSSVKKNYGGSLTWKSYYQGLNQVSGIWGYYDRGVLQTKFTGLVNHTNGIWYYVQKGKINFGYTGLVKHTNGIWYYVQKGRINFDHTGLVKNTNGLWYYVQEGRWKSSYTGLINNANNNWYYVRDGRWKSDYTGFVTHTNGITYYVKKSRLDWDFTGLVEDNGNCYYVKNGRLAASFSGLIQISGTWCYIDSGRLHSGYTGFVKHTNGISYYIQNGYLDWDFTGIVEEGNSSYYVKKGRLASDFTGLVKHSDGDWYYIEGGQHIPDYTGLATNSGRNYYVSNGKINWSFNGTVTFNGETYIVVNGRAQLQSLSIEETAPQVALPEEPVPEETVPEETVPEETVPEEV